MNSIFFSKYELTTFDFAIGLNHEDGGRWLSLFAKYLKKFRETGEIAFKKEELLSKRATEDDLFILDEFFAKDEDGKYSFHSIAKYLKESLESYEKKSSAGKKGGENKKKKHEPDEAESKSEQANSSFAKAECESAKAKHENDEAKLDFDEAKHESAKAELDFAKAESSFACDLLKQKSVLLDSNNTSKSNSTNINTINDLKPLVESYKGGYRGESLVYDAPSGEVAAPEKQKKDKSSDESKSTRGCRIPDGWEPSTALRDWVFKTDKSLTPEDLEKTIANFNDYWKAKAGKDGVKSDWDATFRNWVRRDAERREEKRKRDLKNSVKSDGIPPVSQFTVTREVF